jgi:hypothetical protein
MVFGQVKVVCGGTSWQLVKRRVAYRWVFFLIMMVVDEEEIMVRISVCLW